MAILILFKSKDFFLFNLNEKILNKEIWIIFIYRNKDGKPEFDFDTDAEDIRLPEIRSEETQAKWRRDYYKQRRDSNDVPEMEFSLRVSERERKRRPTDRETSWYLWPVVVLQCECKCVCFRRSLENVNTVS